MVILTILILQITNFRKRIRTLKVTDKVAENKVKIEYQPEDKVFNIIFQGVWILYKKLQWDKAVFPRLIGRGGIHP